MILLITRELTQTDIVLIKLASVASIFWYLVVISLYMGILFGGNGYQSKKQCRGG